MGANPTPAPLQRSRLHVPWSLVPSIVLPGAVVLALLRYAVDLLVPFSLVLLIPHSIRDTLADWLAGERYAGEPDPVWAVAVVSIGLFGTAAGVLWLLSTSQWAVGAGLQAWIPTQVVDLTHDAEQSGWGQRVLLSGGPRRLGPSVVQGPPEADPVQARTSSPAARDRSPNRREVPAETEGTAGSVAAPATSPTAPTTPTTTTLTTSAGRIRADSDTLRLTARVTAGDRSVTGSVTLWDGASMLGSAALDNTGRAELSVTGLSPGHHRLTARYAGDPGHGASGSRPISIVVSP
jgi:hypothetical protein